MTSFFAEYIRSHALAVNSLVSIESSIEAAGNVIVQSLKAGRKLLLCGNGGSAADAQHIAAELVGRFLTERRGLPALALTTDTSVLTAISNDYGYADVFKRQVEALAQEGDILVGISTSGKSENVIAAVKAASAQGCRTIGLLGREGAPLKSLVDYPVVVPASTTAHIQECHIIIAHFWCAMVDRQ